MLKRAYKVLGNGGLINVVFWQAINIKIVGRFLSCRIVISAS